MESVGYVSGGGHGTQDPHRPLAALASRNVDTEDPREQADRGQPMRGEIEQLFVERGLGDGRQLELALRANSGPGKPEEYVAREQVTNVGAWLGPQKSAIPCVVIPTRYDGFVPQASKRAAPAPFDVKKRATYVFDFGVAAPRVPDSIAPDGSLRKTIGASYFQLANTTVSSSDGTAVHVSSSQKDGKPRIHLCAIRRGVVLHKVEQSVVKSIERTVGMIALASQVPTLLKGGLIYRYTGQTVGRDIHFMMYAGSPLARLLSTVAYPSNFASILQPYHLPASVRPDPAVDAALRWYSKCLEAKDDVERFAFCWICFEILASQQEDEGDPVPYIPDCGHELRECPVEGCQQSLMKRPGGKRWIELLASWGMDAQLAKDLWKTRMMFHGANRMEWKNVTRLPEQTTLLRKLVSSKLSEALHLSGGAIQPSHVGALQTALWCEKVVNPDELSRWESAGLTRT